MAFELGIDIGDYTVEFCSDSYVAESSKVFTPLSFELHDPTMEEYYEDSYVSEGIKVFAPLSLELHDPTMEEYGETLVGGDYKDKVFLDTAQIYVTILPIVDGDTGQLIVVGAACQFSYSIINTKPYTVRFFDETSGDTAEWHWNFGDGHYSTEQHPTHIYEPGQYEAELNVKFTSEKWGWCSKNLYLPIIDFITPPPNPSYGNHETPVSLGSGSGYFHNPTDYLGQETRGGGAIEITAQSGTVSVNGFVNMSGQDGTHSGGAAGGSIWIKAWKIDGTGFMSAEGGDTLLSSDSTAGGGGGGYISLWHGHTIDFDGTMSVKGGGYK